MDYSSSSLEPSSSSISPGSHGGESLQSDVKKKTSPIRREISKAEISKAEISKARNSTPRSLSKVSPELLFGDSSEEERFILGAALSKTVKQFLLSGRSVWLDSFGVLFPKMTQQLRTHIHEDSMVVRNESSVSIEFEKCCDLTQLPRDRFGSIVETRELAARVYPKFPLAMQLRWDLEDTKRYLQGLSRTLRDEVVTHGFSDRLGKLGTFYALNNRTGEKVSEWYAGADIFIDSRVKQLREIGNAAVFERPVLESSFELLEAAYGKPIKVFSCDCSKELAEIDIIVEPDSCQLPARFDVAVFVIHSNNPGNNSNKGHRSLVYVTDGLRNGGTTSTARCELAFRITDSGKESTPPLWPCRPLSLAWLMLQQSGNSDFGHKSADDGASSSRSIVPINAPITKVNGCQLTGVALMPFEIAPYAHKSSVGEFYFANVVGVTQDELQLSGNLSWEHLYALLKRKGLSQITKSSRSSIIAKTTVIPLESNRKLKLFGSSEPKGVSLQ